MLECSCRKKADISKKADGRSGGIRVEGKRTLENDSKDKCKGGRCSLIEDIKVSVNARLKENGYRLGKNISPLQAG